MTKVLKHILKIYIVQSFLSLMKQTKFKIYTRKTPLVASRRTSTTFIIFCQDKRKLHALDSPSPLQSLPPPKECAYVRAYGHVTTKFSRMDRLPNCLSYWAALACASCVHKFTCEITKLPWQHSVDISVCTWLTLDQHSTNTWPALKWHMDRYVGQHSVDMSTDSSGGI